MDQIPPRVRQAFLAAEDASFYEHGGLDLSGVVRAAWRNLAAGKIVQGGSTITQQVVKALLLTPTKTFERKFKELVLARRLERQLSKDEILLIYLNQIYFGSGAYGVEAAAREYFSKSARELNLAEAALLAGLPKAPERYSPRHNWQRARRRQRYVLRRMEAEGFISRTERRDAERTVVDIEKERLPAVRAAPDYVEHVRRSLVDHYGDHAAYRGGLEIFTALDLDMQNAAEKALRRHLRALDRRHGYRGPDRQLSGEQARAFLASQIAALSGSPPAVGARVEAVVRRVAADLVVVRVGPFHGVIHTAEARWAEPPKLSRGDVILVRVAKQRPDGTLEVSLDQEPRLEGAILAMDSKTGFVRAMVGGYDFERSQFNRALQARRQPGSTFKPFVYAAALDHGYTPASIVVDAPIAFDDGANEVWQPGNFDGRFLGPMRLREALAKSRNVASVKLARKVGIDRIVGYLPRFGFSRRFPRNLSIALGSSEVTLLELVRAYGVFASGGRLFDPAFILEVKDANGRVLEERRPSAIRSLPRENAYLMTSMLEDVVRHGTGTAARALNRPVAGKTGTTNDMRDAWFVGFTPGLVAGAWVGFDDNSPLDPGDTGSRAALPVWLEFMRSALAGRPISTFPIPEGIVFVNIDPTNGSRATGSGEMFLESFRHGEEPRHFDQSLHRIGAREFHRGDY